MSNWLLNMPVDFNFKYFNFEYSFYQSYCFNDKNSLLLFYRHLWWGNRKKKHTGYQHLKETPTPILIVLRKNRKHSLLFPNLVTRVGKIMIWSFFTKLDGSLSTARVSPQALTQESPRNRTSSPDAIPISKI